MKNYENEYLQKLDTDIKNLINTRKFKKYTDQIDKEIEELEDIFKNYLKELESKKSEINEDVIEEEVVEIQTELTQDETSEKKATGRRGRKKIDPGAK